MDQCTGWLDRLLWWDWSACCGRHDEDYALGVVKPIADGFLQICVNATLPGMGDIMWFGLCVLFGWASKIFYERARQRREEQALTNPQTKE